MSETYAGGDFSHSSNTSGNVSGNVSGGNYTNPGQWQTGIQTYPTTAPTFAPTVTNFPVTSEEVDFGSTDPLEELRGTCLICGSEEDDILISCQLCKEAILYARKALMQLMIDSVKEGETVDIPSGNVE